MAAPMSPLTLSLPVMKAVIGLSSPATSRSKSSSAIVIVVPASVAPSVTVTPESCDVHLPGARPGHVEQIARIDTLGLGRLDPRLEGVKELLRALCHVRLLSSPISARP